MPSADNKRIAKNTVFLYLRMLLLMAISLYTSRVVLNQLGIVDFGIYNVVGGVVAMLSFFNGSMSTATQRFIAYALGRDDKKQVCLVFNMAVLIHVMIAIVLVILAETGGMWYIRHKLVIPAESLNAAIWVFHFSVATAIISIISVPFTALIVAHEDMSIYAYISILEGCLKLAVAFVLLLASTHRLELYAVLVFASVLIIAIIWIVYTHFRYRYSRLAPQWNSTVFREMFSFVGWQSVSQFVMLMRTQGVSLLLNAYFGPVLNAARGIAVQVNGAAIQFVNNFQMASNPQLTKDYANNDLKAMHSLLIRSSRISFLLMFIITFPILMVTEPVLVLWLKILPDYGVVFVQLMLVATLIDLLSGTLVYGALATGKIKSYVLQMNAVFISEFLAVWVLFRFHCPPTSMFYVEFVLFSVALAMRLKLVHLLTKLSIVKFLKGAVARDLSVALVCTIPTLIIRKFVPSTAIGYIILFFSALAIAVLATILVGFSKSERKYAISTLRTKLHL